MAAARAAITVWTREMDDGLDAIVINTSGCGTTVKDYGFMFRSEPEPWAGRAAAVSALAKDVTELLATLDYTPTRPASACASPTTRRAAYSTAQRVTDAPKTCSVAPVFRWWNQPSRTSAAARPASTTSCSPKSPAASASASWKHRPHPPAWLPRQHRLHHPARPGHNPGHPHGRAAGLDGRRPQARRVAKTRHRRPGRGMRRSTLLIAVLLGAAAPPDPVSPLLDQLHTAPRPSRLRHRSKRSSPPGRPVLLPPSNCSKTARSSRSRNTTQRPRSATLDAALDLQPDQAELWRLHAEARFSGGDEAGAFADLAQALSRRAALLSRPGRSVAFRRGTPRLRPRARRMAKTARDRSQGPSGRGPAGRPCNARSPASHFEAVCKRTPAAI